MNRQKPLIDWPQLRFYLWLALAYWAFWVVVDISSVGGFLGARIVNNLWRTVYVLGINFFFFEYTIPYVWAKKNLFVRIILLLIVIWIQFMLYSFGLFAWRLIGIGMHAYIPLKTFKSTLEGVNYGVGFGMFSMVFFGVSKYVYAYNKLKAAAQQLRIEKQEAELNYLRSQTNPHFLFNTLNNIYSLSRDKSDLAPESILRLSKILRFMLYETSGTYIAIEQELKIITDYIELEKLRYDESLRINFNYDVEDMKQALPPLLLIPLVENAFKHGVSETRSQPFVDIHLGVRNRQLVFSVKNSTEVSYEQEPVKENIGLSNLRRQLELLYRDYGLLVQQEQGAFTATLKINLASHV
jgi:two-component system, LytTR family, sensor kinase